MFCSIYEILFFIFYFVIRLYSLANEKLILSYNNGKLHEYMKKENLHNIANNLVKTNKKQLSSNNVLFLISPKKYKQEFFILLITFEILAIIVVFRYNLIFSNFIYIQIFNKNIDIVSFFSKYYPFVRTLYLFIFVLCIYDMLKQFFKSKFLYQCYLCLNRKKIQESKEKKMQELLKKEIIIGWKEKQMIYIQQKGLFQNILVTGSIGSGKTSGAIANILDGFIKNGWNGLILDIKGNFYDLVVKIAKKYHREKDVVVFSLGNDLKYNPLNSHVDEVYLANNLRKVLTLLSINNNSDSFWIDKVEGYLRDFICLIKAYSDCINFYEIHQLVTNKEYLLEKLQLIKEKILEDKYSEEELFKINTSMQNIKKEYLTLDYRTLNIIRAEITRITSVFVTDYHIYKKFCFFTDRLDFFHKIVVFSMDIGKYQNLAKIVATYMKLDFQREVLLRNTNILNQKKIVNPIFFVCDEFQEVCNEEDASFFSLSREYQCINLVSMQSYTSLIRVVKEDAAKVIIQSLVNKIWFRNDDVYTIQEIMKLIGKEVKNYHSINISENGQHTRFQMLNRNFVDYKTGISKGYVINPSLEYKLNEEYFTSTLQTFEAACLLSDGTCVEYVDKVSLKRWEC